MVEVSWTARDKKDDIIGFCFPNGSTSIAIFTNGDPAFPFNVYQKWVELADLPSKISNIDCISYLKEKVVQDVKSIERTRDETRDSA